ncbi:MAG: protein kinase [Deltaproteobacteria bacterium]|nr:protein kinase [Deltaproteobacteria bacterium]
MVLIAGSPIGRYKVLDLIGRGSMGEVYRGWDEALDRIAAIKIVHPDRATRPDAKSQIFREARLAARISHPAVAHIYEVGEAEGRPYIAMEYVPGRQLRAEMARRQPIERAVFLIRQILDGVGEAHRKGVIHRDLKPENILLWGRDQVKILDFGLAIPVIDDLGKSVSKLVGTPRYMAPEQFRGESVNPRTDLFAVGAILYELVAGRAVFDSNTIEEVRSAVLSGSLPELSEDLPVEVGETIRRALAQKADERFISARAMSDSLVGLGEVEIPKTTIQARPQLGMDDDEVTVKAPVLRSSKGADPVVQPSVSRNSAPTTGRLSLPKLGSNPIAAPSPSGSRGSPTGATSRAGSGSSRPSAAPRNPVGSPAARPASGGARVASGARTASSDGLEPHPQARVLARRARESLVGFGSGSILAAEMADKAIEIDPGYALAHAIRAEAFAARFYADRADPTWLDEAQASLDRAERIDPKLPDTRVARAQLIWNKVFNFPAETALRELEVALDTDPDHPGALRLWANITGHVGLLPSAERAIRRRLAADPNDQIMRLLRVGLQLQKLEAKEAAEDLSAALRLDPGHEEVLAWWLLAHAKLYLGEIGEAERIIAETRKKWPEETNLVGLLALARALDGDAEGARRWAGTLKSFVKSESHPHHTFHHLACMESVLGDAKSSLRWLRRAADEGFVCTPWFASDPMLQELRRSRSGATFLRELERRQTFYERAFGRALPEPP